MLDPLSMMYMSKLTYRLFQALDKLYGRCICHTWERVQPINQHTVEPGCQAVLVVKRWLVVKHPLACCQKAFVQRRI